MNKLKETFHFILIIILILLTHCSINENKLLNIQDIEKRIHRIKTYHVLLNTTIYPPSNSQLKSKMSKKFDDNIFSNSTIFGESGKRMKIITEINSNKLNKQMNFTLIYDGKWLWIEKVINANINDKRDTTMIEAMKISITDISPDPEKEPFYAQYAIQGIGLSKQKDFPGTLIEIINSYDLKRSKTNKLPNKLAFSGEKIINEEVNFLDRKIDDEKVKKQINTFFSQINRYCKLFVSKKDTLIDSYSIGSSDNQLYMDTSIKYISINDKLPEDIFTYTPPENIKVHDITSTIKDNLVSSEQIGF